MTFRSAAHKPNVLVLSHLFPNSHQPNLGCFVSEQVRALRERQNIDARVVACYPYWCSRLDPFSVVASLTEYYRKLRASRWTEHNGVPILYLPYLVGKPFFPYMYHGYTYTMSIRLAKAKIRRKFPFDIVHAHTGYLDGGAGQYLARTYNIPYLITEHTGPFTVLMKNSVVRRRTLEALSNADKILAVSPALAEEMQKWLPSPMDGKMIVLPNGVDKNLFFPATACKDERGDEPLKLLSVISLEDIKNPFLLLQAAEKLIHEGREIQVKIAGDGPLRGQMEDWLNARGLERQIKLLGGQSRQEIARLMREECDIFVLTSRAETFGVVVIEALASGKPVVSTRCGGPESVVTEPYLGALCANDNPDMLASVIAEVSNRLTICQTAEIRQYAIENYCYSGLADRIAAIYRELAGKTAEPRGD